MRKIARREEGRNRIGWKECKKMGEGEEGEMERGREYEKEGGKERERDEGVRREINKGNTSKRESTSHHPIIPFFSILIIFP